MGCHTPRTAPSARQAGAPCRCRKAALGSRLVRGYALVLAWSHILCILPCQSARPEQPLACQLLRGARCGLLLVGALLLQPRRRRRIWGSRQGPGMWRRLGRALYGCCGCGWHHLC